jgi:predicted AAA+ superfamily ATPase
MYVSRFLSQILRKTLKQFPAVLVTGPRQSGKTTFLLHEFQHDFDYVSFDDPLERAFALQDPQGFLNRFKNKPVILDEIQYVPEILPYLKMKIDAKRQQYGHWLLTGSQQFQLMKNVTESLAGRIALLELFPFSILETGSDRTKPLESLIWSGGYPEPFLMPGKRDLWLKSYLQTYVERDVRQLQNVRDLHDFETFLGLCAAYHGQFFNTAALSRKSGVSLPTIKAWAGVLEASYLCRFLPPYFKNFGKRLVKTPKLYFIDSAIVCTLTRQPSREASLAGPMGGSLFEGFILSETLKIFAASGKNVDCFFWRSHDGLEVDLVLQLKGRLVPVEIKLTATPTMKHLEPLIQFKSLARQEGSSEGVLICRVEKPTPLPQNNLALPWQKFPAWLRERI